MGQPPRSSRIDLPTLLRDIKLRIQQAQTRAVMNVNAELLRLYWDIGRMIDARQQHEGWGAGVIPRLAKALLNELPEEKGFSERNIKLMVQFAREYPDAFGATRPNGQPAISHLPTHSNGQPMVAQIPWAHNVLLMQRVKNSGDRRWYMSETISNGWSRSVLLAMIQSQAHRRKGRSISNFQQRLPPPQSDLVQQTLKDPYVFDFLTLTESFQERELESGLIQHVQHFLLELGQGFAFVGRQVHIEIADQDFYVDLLFYHLRLRCYIVVDLKKGKFRPEYAGKMNFYLGVVDDKLRHSSDAPSIGMILCQDRNQVIAEYALRDIKKPMSISAYNFARALPKFLQSSLPTIKQIESELTTSSKPTAKMKKRSLKPNQPPSP